jgi:hypothetical protein
VEKLINFSLSPAGVVFAVAPVVSDLFGATSIASMFQLLQAIYKEIARD